MKPVDPYRTGNFTVTFNQTYNSTSDSSLDNSLLAAIAHNTALQNELTRNLIHKDLKDIESKLSSLGEGNYTVSVSAPQALTLNETDYFDFSSYGNGTDYLAEEKGILQAFLDNVIDSLRSFITSRIQLQLDSAVCSFSADMFGRAVVIDFCDTRVVNVLHIFGSVLIAVTTLAAVVIIFL